MARLFLALLIGAGLLFVWNIGQRFVEFPPIVKEQADIRLVFVGDIMLSRKIGDIMEKKDDYTLLFASTSELLRSADIAFANLESPISTRGVRSGSVYSFRADPKSVAGLMEAGFDVVSVANNHIWDYGRQAFLDTLVNLSEKGIVAVGAGANYAEAHTPRIIKAGGTRVAFLAYTNLISPFLGDASSTPAVARFTDDILKADIEKAKKLADVVVVSFHWGDEYKGKHNREQERIGKLAIDAGANLIVGHHPHVVQEVEEYNGGYILYSLGNFVFDQNFSKDTGKGLLVEVTVSDHSITRVTEREIAFTRDYTPYILNER